MNRALAALVLPQLAQGSQSTRQPHARHIDPVEVQQGPAVQSTLQGLAEAFLQVLASGPPEQASTALVRDLLVLVVALSYRRPSQRSAHRQQLQHQSPRPQLQ